MSPTILLYAVPGFIILMLLEVWYSYKEHKHLYERKDAWAGIGLGLGNLAVGALSKGLSFGAYTLLYEYRFFTLDSGAWWFWVLALLADDFSYYWFHRMSHHIRFFWASHVVHHSSQFYNLAAAVRQTWTGHITGAFVFWLWMPLLGFHPLAILIMQQISLVYQYWIHTEVIQKLPAPIEFIMNTPSHHRVHHGVDLKYLDRNHGGIFIIWDRLFGSFQREEERPTYGLTKNVDSFNPAVIAFKEWWLLAKDMAKGKTIGNAIRYLIHPPGWSHDGSSKTAHQLRKEAAKQ
jgi:sterol desaturase/sphingolipid hydroxylase (fatty acid hydroxylase superfamily)